MATEVFPSFLQITDSNGAIVSGAEISVYAVNSTTLLNVYSDAGLSVGAANPIICDSAGRADMRYIAAGSYKVVIRRTGAGATILTRDYIDGRVPIGSGALAIANGGTGQTTAGAALTALGGATAAELAAVSADVAALSGTLASTEKTHIATGTTGQRPATPVAGDIRYNTSIGTEGIIEFYDGTEWRSLSFAQPPAGRYFNKVIKVASNTTIDVSCDWITTSNGTLAQTTALSSTINLAVQSAANGLDNATPVAIDTWYYLWAIAKPDGTTNGLASTSSSAPSLPTGYTYKAYLGAVQTIHASATLYGTWQFGNRARYKVGLAQTTVAVPMLAASATASAWTSLATTRFAPATATEIILHAYQNTGTGSAALAPNASYGNGAAVTTNHAPISNNGGAAGSAPNMNGSLQLETAAIYYYTTTTDLYIWVDGWVDKD